MIHRKPRYRLPEAFALLGISRAHGYSRIAAGLLRVQKDGRRSFVTADEIDRYTGGPPRATASPAAQSAA